MNGPACPQCGWLLRWIADQGAWGCDRCRTMHPATPQVAQQPSRPAAPPAAMPYAPAAPGSFAGASPARPSAPSNAPYAATPGSFAGAAQARPPATAGVSNQPYPVQPNPYRTPPPAAPAPTQVPSPYPSAAPYLAQQAQMLQGASGHARPPARAPAKPGSKQGLLIGVGALVLIGGVIGIVVAATSGGGPSAGGVATRDELVKQTLAAIEQGDVDALVALTPSDDSMADMAECEKPGDAETAAKDRKTGRELMRKTYQERVDQAKGAKLALVEIGEPKTTTIAKGQPAGVGCTFTKAHSFHTLPTRLKVQQGERTGELKADLAAVELDGVWYLMVPPEIKQGPDCIASIATYIAMSRKARPQISGSSMGRIEKKMVEHCNDDGWPDDALECLAADPKGENPERCMKLLTSSQSDKLMKDVSAVLEQDRIANAPPPDAAPPPPDAGDPLPPEEPVGAVAGSAAVAEPVELPASCVDWGEQIGKLDRCRKLKAAQRRAIKHSYAIVVKSFGDMTTVSSAMRENFDKTCRRGVDDVLELRKLCR